MSNDELMQAMEAEYQAEFEAEFEAAAATERAGYKPKPRPRPKRGISRAEIAARLAGLESRVAELELKEAFLFFRERLRDGRR